MPLGDSLTGGAWEAPGYRNFLGKKLAENGHNFVFVGTSKPRIRGEWQDPRNEGHEGHGGWRLTDLTGETKPRPGSESAQGTLPSWLATEKPDTIILLAGANDESEQTEEEYVRRFGTVLAQIGAYRKDVKIVVGLLPSPDIANIPDTAVKSWQLKRSAAQKAVEAAKAEGLKVFAVDTNEKFMYRVDLIDRVHPTQNGFRKIADALYAGLVQSGG